MGYSFWVVKDDTSVSVISVYVVNKAKTASAPEDNAKELAKGFNHHRGLDHFAIQGGNILRKADHLEQSHAAADHPGEGMSHGACSERGPQSGEGGWGGAADDNGYDELLDDQVLTSEVEALTRVAYLQSCVNLGARRRLVVTKHSLHNLHQCSR